jgi:YggT family protein
VGELLLQIIQIVFTVFSLILLARALVSWFIQDPYSPIVQFLHRVTEPVLAPIRRVIPPVGMMDLSPMVALILVIVVQRILTQIIISLFF